MNDPYDDLAVIRRIMEETRGEVHDRGIHFVIWGMISTVGLLVTWLAVAGRVTVDPTVVWAGLLVAGWAASLVAGWREGRRARVRTLGRRILSWMWISVAVTLTLIGLAGMFGGGVGSVGLPGLLAVVLAAPILVTGRLTGEGWLMGVAAVWWIGGATMLFVPGPYTLLLLAGMSLVLLVVPGGVLNARSRSGPAETAVTDPA